MNDQQKNDYRLRFQRFQLSREKHFAPIINKALIEQYTVVARNAEKDGIEAVNKINPVELGKILTSMYFDAGTIFGAKIQADITKFKTREAKSMQPMGFSQRMHELIKQYFGVDILNTSQGITDTTKELIKKVFIDAYSQGLGINEIVKQLQNTELSKTRARMIARTESVTAANAGGYIVAKETGLLLNKTWLAAKDDRTRHDHREVDGHTVGRDDYFKVGDSTMLMPGGRTQEDGSEVPAKEVVNCRCTTIYRPVRGADGRLIRV